MSGLSASESTAVEAAVEEYVKGLFSSLMKSLHDDEKDAVARFTAGIEFVRKGKALALAVPVALPTTRGAQLASVSSSRRKVARKSATKTK